MSRTGEKISLDAFLEELSAEDAAEARIAAARIDDLARVGHRLGAVEERFRPYALWSGCLFILGFALFLMPDIVNRWVALFFLATFPGVCAVYAWKTRERTWADSDIEKLNRSSFLPHGGIYFPGSDTPAGVVRVDYTPPPPEPPPGTYPKDPRKPENQIGSRW